MILKSKANLNQLQFTPSTHELNTFYYLNTLDILTTYYGISSDEAIEFNPLLNSRPSIGELIAFKLIWGNIAYKLYPDYLPLANNLLRVAIANNIYILHRIDKI